MKKILFSLLCLLVGQATMAREVANTKTPASVPIGFVENKGQIRDSKGAHRPDVLFTAQFNGATAYFKTDAISYVFHQNTTQGGEVISSKSMRSDVVFRNANTRARIITENQQPGLRNYYNPANPKGIKGVKSFAKITYSNLYPNIDLVVYTQGGEKSSAGANGFKYEFVVKPGGNVADIQLSYEGFSNINIQRDGSVHVQNAFGSLSEKKPYTYSEGSKSTEIPSEYQLKNGTLTFKVGDYDKSKNLVVDPLVAIWGTNVGGSAFDRALGVTVDNSNRVIYAGITASTNYPITPGVGFDDQTLGGTNDVVISRFIGNNPSSLDYSTYYGGSGIDQGLAISSDNTGAVVVAGFTSSNDFPTTLSGNGTGIAGDGFLIKLDDNGDQVWATYYGGSSNDQFSGVAVNKTTGDVYAVGRAFSAGLATVNNLTNRSRDVIVAKFNSAGARQWSSYLGGRLDDQGTAVAIDASDNVYVSGSTTSPDLVSANTFQAVPTPQQTVLGGSNDAFVAKFSSVGVPQWATYYGGASNDFGNAITVDASNNVYFAGSTFSTDFHSSGKTQVGFTVQPQATIGGLADGFIVGYNAAGTRTLSTYLGGNASDQLFGITSVGTNVYVTGSTNSTNYGTSYPNGFTVAAPFSNSPVGVLDMNITKFNPSTPATFEWNMIYGAANDEVGRAIGANATGMFSAVGYTNSSTLATFNPPRPQSPAATGNDDAIVVVLSEDAPVVCTPFVTVANPTATTCPTNNDGKITVTTPAPGAGITYTLKRGGNDISSSATNVFSNLAAANDYTVLATNSNGNCTNETSAITITQGAAPTAAATPASPSCVGGINGSITFTSPAPSANVTYSVVNNTLGINKSQVNNPVFTNLALGTYAVSAIVGTCTTAVISTTIVDPAPFSASAPTIDLVCGQFTATLTVTATGGTSPYKYKITSGPVTFPVARLNVEQDSPDFIDLPEGVYIFSVKDAGGCVTTATGQVNNKRIVVVAIGSPTTCGLANGRVQLNDVANGAPNYTVRLIAQDGTGAVFTDFEGDPLLPLFINLPGNRYFVEVTDELGCKSSNLDQANIISVTNSINPLVGVTPSFRQIKPISCFGDLTDVQIIIPGADFFSLNGGGAQVSSIFTGLTAGDYTVTASTVDGCNLDVPFTFTITQPARLDFSIVPIQPSCDDGTTLGAIQFTPTGGTEPYTYFASTGGNNNFFQPNPLITNLTPGDYTLKVKDANGCESATQTVTIEELITVAIANISAKNTSCTAGNTGEITLDLIGGTAPYLIQLNENAPIATSNLTTIFSSLAPGDYVILVLDSKGCIVTATITVPAATPLKIKEIKLTKPTDCNATEGNIEVIAEGGEPDYIYSVVDVNSPDNFTGESSVPRASNFYIIKVRDRSGEEGYCEVIDSVALNDPGAPAINNVQVIDALCSNDADLISTGQIIVTATSSVRPLFFSIDGGFTFPIQANSVATFKDLSPGTYRIVVATGFPIGCKAFYHRVVVKAPAPIVITDAKVLQQPTCGAGETGGTFSINATGGSGNFAYSMDDARTFQTSSIFTNVYPKAGGYTVAVRDLNGGCTVKGGTYTLFNPSGFTVPVPITKAPDCGMSNGTIKVAPLGGTLPRFYSINGGAEVSSSAASFTFSNLGTGFYTVKVRDSQGCKAIATVNFGEIEVVDQEITKPTCGANDGKIKMLIGGGSRDYTYSVTGAALDGTNVVAGVTPFGPVTGASRDTVSLPNLGPGTYTIVIKDATGSCGLTQTINLSSKGGPAITNVQVQNRNCNIATGNGTTGAISIFAAGPADRFYMLGPNDQAFNKANVAPLEFGRFDASNNTAQNLPAGTYTIFASRGTCVTAGGTYTITEPTLIKIDDVVVTQPTCSGGSSKLGSITVKATGGRNLQYSRDNINWQTSPTFSNLSPDVASISIFVRESGSTACSVQWPYSIQITNGSGLSATVQTQNNPACDDTESGSIVVRVSSGQAPYQMFIDGDKDGSLASNTSTYTFDKLKAATYQIAVVDAAGCIDRLSVVLSDPQNIQVPSTAYKIIQPSSCQAGEILIAVSSIIPFGTYEAQLYDGTFLQPQFADDTIRFQNLISGVYRIRFRDVNSPNCTKDTLIYLRSSAVALLSMDGLIGGNITCFGAIDGTITVNASTPALNPNTVIMASINGIPPTVGGVNTLTGDSRTPIVFSNLAPGTYEVFIRIDTTVVGAGSFCESAFGSFRITITQPDRVLINEVKVTDQNCAAGILGKIEIIAFGGSGELEYSINGGVNYQNENVFTNLQPSNLTGISGINETYEVVVRDKKNRNCAPVVYNQTVRVKNQSQMYLILDQNNGTDVVNVTCPGTKNGKIVYNVLVNVNARPTPFPIKYYLNGELVHTAANSPTLPFVATGLGEGTYELKIIDNNGCEVTQSATVGIFDPIVLKHDILNQPTSCGADNAQIRVRVKGGQEFSTEVYLVLNGDTLISEPVLAPEYNVYQQPDVLAKIYDNLKPGYYQVLARIMNSDCWVKDTVVIRDPNTPTITKVNTTKASNQVCSNGTADVIIFGGGINIKFTILDEKGLNTVAPLQSSSKFNLPSGSYIAAVRTGLGKDINNNDIPFCYSYYGPFSVGCTFSRESVAEVANSNFDVSIYPNPNNGTFVVNFQSIESQDVSLKLRDVTGREVITRSVKSNIGENTIPFELSGYASGVYLLEMRMGQETKTVKVVVE